MQVPLARGNFLHNCAIISLIFATLMVYWTKPFCVWCQMAYTNQWRVPLYPFVFLAALRTNLYDDNWGLSPPKLFIYKISFKSSKYLWELLLSYFADVEIKAHISLERQKISNLSLELPNFPPYMKWKLMWILKRCIYLTKQNIPRITQTISLLGTFPSGWI